MTGHPHHAEHDHSPVRPSLLQMSAWSRIGLSLLFLIPLWIAVYWIIAS